MDKEDERVYPTKLLTGDIAKLFLLNGSSVVCRVDKITHDEVAVSTKSGSRFVFKPV